MQLFWRVLNLTALTPLVLCTIQTAAVSKDLPVTSPLGAALPISVKIKNEGMRVKFDKPALIETHVCNATKPRKVDQAEVYKLTPFKPNEKTVFEVYYSNVYIGDAELIVQPPHPYNDSWHYMFDVYGKTGDWYSSIFKAEDRARAIARASDFGAVWFFLDQNEKKVFSDRKLKERYLSFMPEKCQVILKTVVTKDGKKTVESREPHKYHPSAMDAVTAAFKLRTYDFVVGKSIRDPVYTSKKNWWLEAEPVAIERVPTPIGNVLAFKIKLQTYAGEDLQQKGDMYIWIAKDLPARPIVKITGDVKIGQITAKLKAFTKGKL